MLRTIAGLQNLQSGKIRLKGKTISSEDYNLEHVHLPADPTSGPPQHIDEYWYIPPEMKNDREFWLPQAAGSFYVTDSHNTFFVSKDSTIKRTYLSYDPIVKDNL